VTVCTTQEDPPNKFDLRRLKPNHADAPTKAAAMTSRSG
jgi:hypothetical protein